MIVISYNSSTFITLEHDGLTNASLLNLVASDQCCSTTYSDIVLLTCGSNYELII